MLTVILGSAVAILVGEYWIEYRRKQRELDRMQEGIKKVSKQLDALSNELKGWKK